MGEVIFGPSHPVHRQIAWPCEQWEHLHPITLPASFITHLASNNSVNIEDYALVNEFRETILKDIKAEEHELQQAQAWLARVQDRMNVHKKKAYACDMILSPFRRLPQDVLHEIALQCRPDEGLRGKWKAEYETSPTYHSPSRLSGTCKVWRHIAHHLPQLWQFISIDCTIWSSRNLDVLASSIKRFSELSKSLPLTIHLDDFPSRLHGNPNLNITTDTSMEFILDWLILSWDKPSLNRVRKLSIRPPDAESLMGTLFNYSDAYIQLPHIDTFLMKEMTHVDHIKDTRSNYWEFGNREIFAISSVFPNVKNLWFGQMPGLLGFHPKVFATLSAHIASPANTWQTPFRDITSLYMQPTCDFEDWLWLLSAFPNLQWGSFEVDDESRSSHKPLAGIPPSVHRRLKELILNLRDFSPLSILRPFVGIQFPALRQMQLNFRRIHLIPFDPTYMDNLVPEMFLDRFPVLQTLLLGKEIIREELFHFSGLFPLLLSAPSVTTLSVFTSGLNDIVSLMDFIRQGQGDDLPHLRYLNIGLDLWDVSEPYESLEQGLTRSLVGTSRATDSSIPPSQSPKRLTMPAIRFRLVGILKCWDSGLYLDSRVIGDADTEGDYSSRMRALEAILHGEHKVDVQIEVDGASEDGLISDVPFDMPLDDWYINRF